MITTVKHSQEIVLIKEKEDIFVSSSLFLSKSKYKILHSKVGFFTKYVKVSNSMINCKQFRFKFSMLILLSVHATYFWIFLLKTLFDVGKEISSEILFPKDEVSWVKETNCCFAQWHGVHNVKLNLHKLLCSLQFWKGPRLQRSYWKIKSSSEDWRESKHHGFVTALFEHVASNLKLQEQWLDLKSNISEKE